MFLDLREMRVVMSLPHAEKMTGATGQMKRQRHEGINKKKKEHVCPPLLPRSAFLRESEPKGNAQNGKIGQPRLRFGSRPVDLR